MTTFQLDQCANSKKFADNCDSKNMCIVYRWPKRLEGEKDQNFLPKYLIGENPLVTFDHTIAEDNSSYIPDKNSGIIIINDNGSPHTLTISRAQEILSQFKAAFPEWHTTSWRNSIVMISGMRIYVSRIISNQLNEIGQYEIKDPNFTRELTSVLKKNSLAS